MACHYPVHLLSGVLVIRCAMSRHKTGYTACIRVKMGP